MRGPETDRRAVAAAARAGGAEGGLEDRVYRAILAEYQSRITNQAVDSPEGHVRAFARAVVRELTG